MAQVQVTKKGEDLCVCINNEQENPVKDGIRILPNVTKSKRRRARGKHKQLITVTDQIADTAVNNNLIIAQDVEKSSSAIVKETDNRLQQINSTEVKDCNITIENNTVDTNKKNEMEKNIQDKNTILAQRQEKKLAKQAAKMKNKNKKDTSSTQIIKDNNKSDKKENVISDKPVENMISSIVSTSANTPEKTDLKLDKKQIDTPTPTKAPEKIEINISQNKSGEILKKSEKSREEILAEREARKQAKLNAKKAKGEQQLSTNVETNDKSDKPQIAEVKVKCEDTGQDQVDTAAPPLGKSKAELRAERRAKQEAQRAAKEAGKLCKLEQERNNNNTISNNNINIVKSEKKVEIIADNKRHKEKAQTTLVNIGHQRVKLFSHLKFEQKNFEAKLMHNIHPEIVQLGLKYSSRIIMGSNARCVALLKALKGVIMDYITPSEKQFSRGLESQLSNIMTYLNKCRPSSVSMTNAIRHLKSHLTQLPNDISDEEARRKLWDVIDTYIREQIDVAGEAICNTVQNKIANGDNILIYACSSLLIRILVESHKSGKQFTVVVVDSGPWFEGREMLRRLVDHGIKCSYVLVSALSFIMREVTKVLLGAHALLANGSVMSRAGSALVALVANNYNVPVLVCCETYKFCERVQMDAFVYNELGNEEDMDYARADESKESEPSYSLLSVLYDITPAELVTAVVTELAILPCTSVPVILRIRPSDVVS